MILEIYVFIIIISLIFLMLSFWMEQDSTKIDTVIILRIVGTIGLFTMGFVMMDGNIEYMNGATLVENGSTTTVTHNYANYDNNTLGFLIMLLGGFGFALTLWEIRNIRREGYEDGGT